MVERLGVKRGETTGRSVASARYARPFGTRAADDVGIVLTTMQVNWFEGYYYADR